MAERDFKIGTALLLGVALAAGCSQTPKPSPESTPEPDPIIDKDGNPYIRIRNCNQEIAGEHESPIQDWDGRFEAPIHCEISLAPRTEDIQLELTGLEGAIAISEARTPRKVDIISEISIPSETPNGKHNVTISILCSVVGLTEWIKCGEIPLEIRITTPPEVMLENAAEEADDAIPDILPPVTLVGCNIVTTIYKDTSPSNSGLLLGDGCALEDNSDEGVGWNIRVKDPNDFVAGIGPIPSSGSGSTFIRTYINPNFAEGIYTGTQEVECNNFDAGEASSLIKCGEIRYEITLLDHNPNPGPPPLALNCDVVVTIGRNNTEEGWRATGPAVCVIHSNTATSWRFEPDWEHDSQGFITEGGIIKQGETIRLAPYVALAKPNGVYEGEHDVTCTEEDTTKNQIIGWRNCGKVTYKITLVDFVEDILDLQP